MKKVVAVLIIVFTLTGCYRNPKPQNQEYEYWQFPERGCDQTWSLE